MIAIKPTSQQDSQFSGRQPRLGLGLIMYHDRPQSADSSAFRQENARLEDLENEQPISLSTSGNATLNTVLIPSA